MNANYEDILSRIPEPPKWFNEHAVPRFCDFSPEETANIYATRVALVQIACQRCGREFKVCMSESGWEIFKGKMSLKDEILVGSLHYGDPPNVRCCEVGPTMNCIDLRVIEYWHRGKDFEWVRDAALEIALPDGREVGNPQR